MLLLSLLSGFNLPIRRAGGGRLGLRLYVVMSGIAPYNTVELVLVASIGTVFDLMGYDLAESGFLEALVCVELHTHFGIRMGDLKSA